MIDLQFIGSRVSASTFGAASRALSLPSVLAFLASAAFAGALVLRVLRRKRTLLPIRRNRVDIDGTKRILTPYELGAAVVWPTRSECGNR